MLKGKEARYFCLIVRSAAVLFACRCADFLFPLALISAPGQGSAQRQTHGSLVRERERGERVKKTEKDRRSVSLGDLVRINRRDGVVCLGRRSTLGGLLKETGQCVKGEWKKEGGGVEEGGLALPWPG